MADRVESAELAALLAAIEVERKAEIAAEEFFNRPRLLASYDKQFHLRRTAEAAKHRREAADAWMATLG